MTFHRPIDSRQLETGKKIHKAMRSNLREIRGQFPPRTDDELEFLRRYREVIQDFGRELLKPRGKSMLID